MGAPVQLFAGPHTADCDVAGGGIDQPVQVANDRGLQRVDVLGLATVPRDSRPRTFR